MDDVFHLKLLRFIFISLRNFWNISSNQPKFSHWILLFFILFYFALLPRKNHDKNLILFLFFNLFHQKVKHR